MARVQIQDLVTVGLDLFSTLEGYMNEITFEKSHQIYGGSTVDCSYYLSVQFTHWGEKKGWWQ